MSKQALGVVIAGFFTVFIAYAVRYGYGMILPEMLSSLHISKTEAGVIYASYFLAYTVFSPVVGLLSDRYDVCVLLTVFTGILAVGSLLMAFATTVFNASVFFTLAGIGHAACWTPVVSVVQQWVPDHRRGAILAVTTMGSQTGIAFWSLLLPVIVREYNWQAGWIGMGCFGFVVAGLDFLLFHNAPEIEKQRRVQRPVSCRAGEGTVRYWKLLKSKHLWFIGLSYLFVGFTVLVPVTFFCTYATEKLHLPYALATRFITVIAVSGLVGKLVLGIYSDKWGRIRVMMLCGLLMGAGCWGMTAASEPLGIYAFSGLYGLGFGAVWPVYAAAASDFFDKTITGSVIGLWTVFMGIGSILSPVVCGWVIDTTGSYTWAFNVGTICSLLSALFLLPVFRPEGVRSDFDRKKGP